MNQDWKGNVEPSRSRASGVVRISERRACAGDRSAAALLSMVAHDLRSPLAAVLMGLRELERDGAVLSDAQRRLVNAVELETRRALVSADDLSDLAALQRGSLRPNLEEVELGELVHAAVDGMAASGVALDLPAAPLIVRVDVRRMKRVLTGLVLEAAQRARDQVEVRVRSHNRSGCVQLSDDGHEKPERVEALLDALRRERVEVAGSGLALRLALARDLVALHGGSITVSRARLRLHGLTVRLVLPEAGPQRLSD
jgi:K+-sensing histidine kinase KdpD